MANHYGMLGLGAADAMDERALNAQRQRAMDYARLTPQQQSSFNMNMGAQMVGQGVGALAGAGVGMLTGQDTRGTADKVRGVQAQMVQALQGVPPGDVDTAYPIMIKVLQQNGMVPEAMAMAKEYEDIQNKRRDDARAVQKDEAAAADRAARIELLSRGTQLQQNVEALGKLQDARNNMVPGSPAYEAISQRIQITEDAIARRNVQTADLGDRRGVYINGVLVSTEPKGIDPNAKYRADNPRPTATSMSLKEVGKREDGSPVYMDTKTGFKYVGGADGNPERYAGPYNAKETETEAKKRQFSDAMTQANADMVSPNFKPASRLTLAAVFKTDESPIQQAAVMSVVSDQTKQSIAAVRQFLNATLRDESGAAIPPSEYPKYFDPYIPLDDDSPALRAQKQRNRELIISAVGRLGRPLSITEARAAIRGDNKAGAGSTNGARTVTTPAGKATVSNW